MIIDENKLKRQLIGVEKLKQNNYTGILEYATGVGKTYTAILAIKNLLAKEFLSINVVVPRDNLKDQWNNELKNHKIISDVYVVNTYIKEKRKCDILILDEVHKYSNEEAEFFSKVLELTEYKYVICLSATLDKEKKEFLLRYGIPIIDTITLAEAKRNGWVSDFIQYNLGVKLIESEQKEYNTHTNVIKYHFPFFNNDLGFALQCLNNKVISLQFSRECGIPQNEVIFKAVRFNQAMQKRKKLMYEGQAKIDIIQEIVREERKTIIFSESTIYADLVETTIPNSVAYHSNLPTRIINGKKFGKKKLLDRAMIMIKSGLARCIITARSMDEGIDIDDLDCAIIASGTQKVLQLTQRIGRTIRVKEDKVAIIINLYFKDTVDETWLNKRQKDMVGIRWINNVNEIEYGN